MIVIATKKKGISPEKLAYKHGKIIMAVAAADFLLTRKEDYVTVLTLNGQKDYVTGDSRVDTESVFNLLMKTAGIRSDIQVLLGKLLTILTELPTIKVKKPLYSKLVILIAQITEKMPKSEYLEVSRKVYMSSQYSFVMTPLFSFLDYVYFPDAFILGDNEGKILSQKAYLSTDGFPVTIPLCFATSIDNMVLENGSNDEYLSILSDYVSEKGLTLFKQEDLVLKVTSVLVAVAKYFSSLSCFGKFGFGSMPHLVAPDLIAYAVGTWDFEYGQHMLCSFLRNVFIDIKKDAFTRRKYIFKDTTFPSVQIIIPAPSEGYTEQKLDNFRVREELIERPDGEYFMIFFEYTYQEQEIKRVIPIVVDNIHATSGEFNLIDFHAVLFLFGLYGIIDELPEILYEGGFGETIESIKRMTSEIEYVDSDGTKSHSKGYHQTKEVKVDAFVRRLPAGQRASIQAIELAKKHRLSLGEGFTIVSPYIKNKGS